MDGKKVAEAAGVSPATVSRVFSQPDLVKPETRERVLRIAKEMNYAPKTGAPTLRQGHKGTVGFVISHMRNPACMCVLDQAARDLRKEGYHVVAAVSDLDLEEERLSLFQMAMSSRMEAIVFIPMGYNRQVETLLKNCNAYVLQLYRRIYDSFDGVVSDTEQGMVQSFEYLYERGHRKLLVVAPATRYSVSCQTFQRLASAHRCVHGRILSLEGNSDWNERIRQAIEEERPTAVLGVTNEAGSAAFRTLRRMGLSIPTDISFLQFGDADYAEFVDLTSIMHDTTRLAKAICDRIHRNLPYEAHSAAPSIRVAVPTHLIERGSVLPR